MNKLLFYLLESGFCLLVFYALYEIFLKRETYYRLNRAYLLFALLFSMLIPLLKISLPGTNPAGLASFQMEPLTVTASGGASQGVAGFGFLTLFGMVYFIVMFILVLRIILNFSNIKNLYRQGRLMHSEHYTLIIHSLNYPPFSFFRNIFISERHYSGGELDDIIEHEKAHVRQLHTADIVLAELLIILQWFNPIAWLYKKLVTENHEFLADEAVINRGFSPEAYQLRILAQLFGIRSMPAVHNFNESITQKRLKMMERSKSSAVSRLKILAVLPAALLLFFMFACKSNQSNLSAQDASGEKSEVYYQVDEAAEPEGGMMAFRKHIAENVLYPKDAAAKGVQGKVYIQFIVDENGKIVKAVQSSEIPPAPPEPPAEQESPGDPPPPPPPPPVTADIEGVVVVGFKPPEDQETDYAKEDIQLLVDEAIRVITEADVVFKPAMKDGKPVKSAWTMPIVFKLQ